MDWNKVKTEYIAGGTSYRKLAEKYKVSFSTLRKIAAKEQWTQLRNNAEIKRDTVLAEKIGNKNAKMDDTYFRLVDKLMQKAEETIENTPVWTVNSLKEMSTALKNLKECKGVKSDIDLREQEARIKSLEKQAQEESKNADITVIIGSEAEDYSV